MIMLMNLRIPLKADNFLFSDAYVAPSGRMDEVGSMWKEVAVVYFKLLS
jgi:hypothetical protein